MRRHGRNMLSAGPLSQRAPGGAILKWKSHGTKLDYGAREHMCCGALQPMAASVNAGGVRRMDRNMLSADPLSQFWARATGVPS